MSKPNKSAFSIHCFGLKFTPNLLSTILAVCMISLFCSLGTWQYHRSESKKILLKNYAEREQHQPLHLSEIQDVNKVEFYPIEVKGFFDTEHQLLVENKFYDHRIGFEVLTPLVLEDRSVILVNRGWVEKAPQLQEKAKTGSMIIHGIIHPLPEKIFQLGRAETTDSWPKLIQNNSWAEVRRVLGNQTIHPFVIILPSSSPLSFIPIYTPSIMSPEKHLGYAFQWFAMALTILIIFIAVNTKKCLK